MKFIFIVVKNMQRKNEPQKYVSLISAISKSVIPKESTVSQSNQKANWYPVLQYIKYDIGISVDGVWVISSGSNLFLMKTQKDFGHMVSLMEFPMDEVKQDITTFLSSHKIEVSPNDFFPFAEIIKAGLLFGSTYWAELALEWYDEMPLENRVYFRSHLIQLKDAKWASQMLRHRARKELSKI